jgi:hypothetical protein
VRFRIALGGAALAGVVACGVLASPGGSSVTAQCSRAAALEVGKPYFWDARYTIAQLLCGSFTGAGSDSMVIAFAAPTCWPLQGWALFTYVDGGWRRDRLRRGAFVFPLKAVGGDIRETEPVFRAGDPRCIPSGGRRARTWHWNGTSLVAGPWQQTQRPTTPPPPPSSTRITYFKSPSGNIICLYTTGAVDQPLSIVVCGIKSGLRPKPPYTARCRELRLGHTADRIALQATGRAQPSPCAGDAGPLLGEREARVLAYGRTWRRGGISCRSAFTGMTCRNRSGHGFFLSRSRWRRF